MKNHILFHLPFHQRALASLTFFCLISISLFSQKKEDLVAGEYVDKAGSSQSGFFDLSRLHKGFVYFFSKKEYKTNTTLTPENTQSIKTEAGVSIFSVTVTYQAETEQIFIKSLNKSSIELFYGKSNWIGDLYYLRTVDKPTITTINKVNPKTWFETYFKENLNCVTGNIRYNSNRLLELVSRISNCMYGDEFPKRVPIQTNFGLGLSLSCATGKPQASSNINAEFNRFFKPGMGISGSFGFGKRLRFRVALNYQDRKIQSNGWEYVSFEGHYSFKYDTPIVLDAKMIENQFSIIYFFQKEKKLRPFVFFGISRNSKLKAEMEPYSVENPISIEGLTEYARNNDPLPIDYPSNRDFRVVRFFQDPYSSQHIGFGFNKHLKNKSELDVAIRYIQNDEPYNNASNSRYWRLKPVFELSATYQLKL